MLTRKRELAFLGFVSPWLLGTILLTLFPLGFALGLSLTDWDGISPRYKIVGLENYREVIAEPTTWKAMGRTFLLTVIIVPAGLISSLFLAVMLNRELAARSALRALIFLPSLVPPVAATLVWKLIFERQAGPANAIVERIGLPPLNWLVGNQVFVVLVLVLMWSVGGGIVLNLAALQSVSLELQEAAELDGASARSRFWHVTVPAISPILLFQVVTGTIAAMQTFLPALLLSPLPGAAAVTAVPEGNQLYMIEVYTRFFALNQYGYASAMLWLFFLAILALTALVFRVSGRAVFYAVEPGK